MKSNVCNDYCLGPYYLLFSALPLCLSGGMATFFTVAYRYVTVVSIPEHRPIRLMLVQFGVVAGSSLGVFAGGLLLRPSDLSQSPTDIRKYHYNFLASAGIDLTSIVLVVLALKVNSKNFKLMSQKQKEEQTTQKTEESFDKPDKGILSSFFDLDNIRSTMKC